MQLSAGTVKKISMELGGNAPFIVFESADLDKAVHGAFCSKFRASGQTCVSANRFFVQSSIYERFIEKFKQYIQKIIVIGDGLTPNVTLGPLINKRAVDKVHSMLSFGKYSKVDFLINEAKANGARLIIGGTSHKMGENFYEPTLICDVTHDMKICDEEIFGPVATIVKFEKEEEALRMANDCRSGLAAYFFSQDLAQIFRVSRHLEAGMIGVNEGIMSACEIGFGGVKESGLGREGGHYGTEDYLNVKYVCLGGL
uniref:Aldehyde dehydrogenase domain-containing protein n=1 Tax=Romanomermis culicivorax TaxID=13658 RepID=A0A915JF97_ROMCU